MWKYVHEQTGVRECTLLRSYFVETCAFIIQKMTFSINVFLSECDQQIRSFLWMWQHLLKKASMKLRFLCSVYEQNIGWLSQNSDAVVQMCSLKRLPYFANFTIKHLCQTLGIPVNFARFSKNTFLTEQFRTTGSDYVAFQLNLKRLGRGNLTAPVVFQNFLILP